jgi:hypothetical protein
LVDWFWLELGEITFDTHIDMGVDLLDQKFE